jgi:hypothetical protein
MDNTKFSKFVKENTVIVRKGSAIRARKVDPENTRLAGNTEHDCEHCDQRVTNQIIFYQKKWTAYKNEPYWYAKCTNCKSILNHRY